MKSSEGEQLFQGGNVGEMLKVYTEKGDSAFWLIPIKKKELFMGVIIVKEPSILPDTYTVFPELKTKLFEPSQDEAYTKMLEEYSQYPAKQITRPILVTGTAGYRWESKIFGKEGIEKIIRIHTHY
ncbi:MAG: hypothetical protein ABH808_02730 [Candidatus Kuenenbacteria bacterium]